MMQRKGIFNMNFRTRKAVLCGFFIALMMASGAVAEDYRLDFIGMQTITPGMVFEKTVVGGAFRD